jgi:hypothetical protein
MKLLRFFAAILSFGVLHTKPWRFVESPRRIDNCLKDTLMLLKNILGEPRNWLSNIETPCSVSWRTANPEERKIGEPWTQLSILLGGSTNLREGLVWNASIIKIAV